MLNHVLHQKEDSIHLTGIHELEKFQVSLRTEKEIWAVACKEGDPISVRIKKDYLSVESTSIRQKELEQQFHEWYATKQSEDAKYSGILYSTEEVEQSDSGDYIAEIEIVYRNQVVSMHPKILSYLLYPNFMDKVRGYPPIEIYLSKNKEYIYIYIFGKYYND